MVRRVLSRLYVMPYTALVSFLGLNTVLTYFTNPRLSAPARTLPPVLGLTWVVLYGLGGLLMLVGISAGFRNLEAAGCWAFIGGALINALAWATLFGWSAWNTILVLSLFVVATSARLLHLVRRQVVVLTFASGAATQYGGL